MRIVKMALWEAMQNLPCVVASYLTRQFATQLKQWPACWNLESVSIACSTDHLQIFVLFWLYLHFILKVCTDLVRSLGVDFSHQPALLLYVSHWKAGQVPWARTETPEIPSEHKKTLSLWGLLNTGSSRPGGLWSLCPWSQLKLDGTQSQATCSD